MMDEMAAGSRRENTAPAPASIMGDTAPTGDFASSSEDAALASIIEETIPGDIETSIRDEASTHANVLDPVSGKATVDEDSTMVAMFEDALITYGDRVYRVSETMQVPIDRFTGTDSRQERIQDRNGFKPEAGAGCTSAHGYAPHHSQLSLQPRLFSSSITTTTNNCQPPPQLQTRRRFYDDPKRSKQLITGAWRSAELIRRL